MTRIKWYVKSARRLLAISFPAALVAAVAPYGSKANDTVVVASIGLDKILHFAGFGLIALLAIGAGKGLLGRQRFLLLVSLPIFGVGIEFVQYYLPYRTFNPVDIFANFLGVACGMTVWGLSRLMPGY